VVQGLDVVFAIVQGDVVQSVKIVRVGKEAEAFRPTTESFQGMVEAARARVQQAEAKKKADEGKTVNRKWPQAKSMENGVKYVVAREGSGEIPSAGMRLKVAYSGRSLYDLRFVSTAEGGRPAFGKLPEPFEVEVGKGLVNRGFDAAVAQMRKGEKRILIVPANQAYGTGGFYDKERPGQKRFRISPNTLLVYEVEVLDIIAR